MRYRKRKRTGPTSRATAEQDFQSCRFLQEIYLNEMLPHQTGFISYLPDNSMLTFLGLRPEKEVEVVTRQRFGGPLIVKTNGRYIAVSRTLAAQIKVVNSLPPEEEKNG